MPETLPNRVELSYTTQAQPIWSSSFVFLPEFVLWVQGATNFIWYIGTCSLDYPKTLGQYVHETTQASLHDRFRKFLLCGAI